MSQCQNANKNETSTAASSRSCCGSQPKETNNPFAQPKVAKDWIFIISAPVVLLSYIAYALFIKGASEHTSMASHQGWEVFTHTSFEMVNAMWWGVLSASFFVGLMGRIPRELILSLLGRPGSKRGIFRATLAGVLLDLCNHGILMVAMKLYERGASIGQVMAFLIASPWNSLTLTLILVGLIGLPYTMLFILGSVIIAWISGWIFDRLVQHKSLPENPNQGEFRKVAFFKELKSAWQNEDWRPRAVFNMIFQGFKESKSVLRWVFFGIVLISLIRTFVPEDSFGLWFGANVSGLFLTLLAATVIEVCSEGSSPIAADLVHRAGAPGNAFTFLMAGAATDYTEIMAIQNTTRSWKIALALPLITVPQVLFIGYLINLS